MEFITISCRIKFCLLQIISIRRSGQTHQLYDFDQSEAQKLIDNIQSEVINRNSDLELSTLKFIEPLNCNLKFTVSTIDLGINASPSKDFICKPNKQSYYEMIGIMVAFVDKENDLEGYNWLYDPSENKIDLLFSPRGSH